MNENPYQTPAIEITPVDDAVVQRNMLIIAVAISTCILLNEGLQNHGIHLPNMIMNHVHRVP